ncbi:hypothetical protein, partial [Xanthomonas campestris]
MPLSSVVKITLSRDRYQREVLIQPSGFCSEARIPLSRDTMRHFFRETKKGCLSNQWSWRQSSFNWSPLKNPLQAPSVIGDSGTALKDGHPIARIQA